MHWKTARAHTTLTSRYLAVNSAGPAATTWFPGQVRIETEKRRHGAHGSRTADVYWWRRTRKSFSSIRARTRERERQSRVMCENCLRLRERTISMVDTRRTAGGGLTYGARPKRPLRYAANVTRFGQRARFPATKMAVWVFFNNTFKSVLRNEVIYAFSVTYSATQKLCGVRWMRRWMCAYINIFTFPHILYCSARR